MWDHPGEYQSNEDCERVDGVVDRIVVVFDPSIHGPSEVAYFVGGEGGVSDGPFGREACLV